MNAYELLKTFKKKYPMTVAWRIKSHSKIIDKHLNPGEEIIYAFAGQKGETYSDLFHTYIVVLTNKRLIVAQKDLLFGYSFLSITPDLYNDLTVDSGIIWGKVTIDTLKEKVVLTNIDKNALPEVETAITEYMMHAKEKYQNNPTENNQPETIEI